VLGFGEVPLAQLLGARLGWHGVECVLYGAAVGHLLALVVGLALCIHRRKTPRSVRLRSAASDQRITAALDAGVPPWNVQRRPVTPIHAPRCGTTALATAPTGTPRTSSRLRCRRRPLTRPRRRAIPGTDIARSRRLSSGRSPGACCRYQTGHGRRRVGGRGAGRPAFCPPWSDTGQGARSVRLLRTIAGRASLAGVGGESSPRVTPCRMAIWSPCAALGCRAPAADDGFGGGMVPWTREPRGELVAPRR
jgi:hypothetical protein